MMRLWSELDIYSIGLFLESKSPSGVRGKEIAFLLIRKMQQLID